MKIEKYIIFHTWQNDSSFTTNLKPNIEVDKLIINLPDIDVELPTSDLINVVAPFFTLQYPLSFEINKTMNSNEIYGMWDELVLQLFNNYRENLDDAREIIKTGIMENKTLYNYLETQALVNYVEDIY